MVYLVWWRIPKILRKINADVFLSPDGFLSLKSNIPSVAVIHDINFKHHPKNLKFIHRVFYNYFKKYAKKASRIVTVSNYSKQDICNSYNIDASKIDLA